jgi:ribosomal protein S8
MTMTDPIADMLTRLRNANQAYHDAVTMPYSKLKQGVADILQQEGYITGYDVEDAVVTLLDGDGCGHGVAQGALGALDRHHGTVDRHVHARRDRDGKLADARHC